ncbi:MAG: cytochrome-c oxidase, cbb3-type subunit I [Verrucomicrobiota bacterium]
MTDGEKITIEYDDRTVRWFTLATVFWAVIAMLAGVYIAFQLNYWQLNLKLPWLTFGRLRPLHTNAAIFAFVGNMMFAGIYYSTQRLCKTRTASDLLSKIHFWGWQGIIVAAAITLPLGLTRGKEYAELIWPINLAVVAIWVVFAVNFFWTLVKRNEPSLYVAIWFYIATIVTVAMLYIVNHLSIPTSLTHSYPVFAGVQDALVQWWYGHNAVAFFLTTPILGIMYYFIPKAAGRPVYSYRLSVVHFWSLVFIYIWAGPHHLLNTALPHWLQALGMCFSLMLWAPSWGGMLNGLLTLRGAWHKLLEDPVLKFMAASVTFYGMATFEGPLLAIRGVNYLSHYSDWTIGHVHSGTLGWNGFMAAGMIYWLVPRLWGTKLYSTKLADYHFWIGFIGILLYVAAMWTSGIRQGLMLNAVNEDGLGLKYAQFVETLTGVWPLLLFRSIGGTFYLIGFLLLVYNVVMTIRAGSPATSRQEVVSWNAPEPKARPKLMEFIEGDPFAATIGIIFSASIWMLGGHVVEWIGLGLTIFFSVIAVRRFKKDTQFWVDWYDRLSENWMPFTVLALIAVAIGGAIQIIPTVTVNRAHNIEDRIQKLYSPLELAGRDIYVSEGCYNCHSQMIRTIMPDVMRYGDYSRLGESIFDHPFQWGSKRTGPDLAREGGQRSNTWHYNHLINPQMQENSIMPPYPWLEEQKTDLKALPKKIGVLSKLGVPYPAMTKHEIQQHAIEQGMEIAESMKGDGVLVDHESKMVALIAYLQKLGQSEEPGDNPAEAAAAELTAQLEAAREAKAQITLSQQP